MAQQNELLQLQVGKETTWGTEVACTAKLAGITDASITPGLEVGEFPTLEGLAPIYNAAIVKNGGEASLSGLVLYEDLPYWLDSLLGEATPTGTTTYTYSYAAPLTSAVASPRMMTLYYGTGSSGYNLLGALVDSLEISGASGEELQLSLGFIGKNVNAEASPAALSDRPVNIAVASDTEIYIDTWAQAAPPSAALACQAYSFNLSIQANRQVIMALGSISPCDTYHQRFDGTLDLTLEFPGSATDDAEALLNSFLTPTLIQRQITIKATLDASHDIEIIFAGTLMDPPEIFGDQDGISTLDLSFKGTYNATLGNWLTIAVVNTVATLV